MLNVDNILFRCSSLGYIMTNPRSKSETLSETCKTHLVDVYTREKYNRFTEIHGKQLEKGNSVEEDSITTISRIIGKFLKKNDEMLSNEFIRGTPDIYIGESIKKALVVRDAKSSWDVFTFNRSIHKDLETNYYWQLQGYSDLTGAQELHIDYCLNNTPHHILLGELRKESYKHNEGDTPNWIELQIIANHIYDKKSFDEFIKMRGINVNDENCQAIYNGFVEIPLKERHFAFSFYRNEDDINEMHERITNCRKWMKEKLHLET